MREVVGAWVFPTYDRALLEVSRRGPGVEILGIDPLRTCVPLPPLTSLRLVDQRGRAPDQHAEVRTFAVLPR